MRIDLHLAVLKVLSYFHFFRYPLKDQEIKQYLPEHRCENICNILQELQNAGIIFNLDGFFSLSNDTELVTARLAGNKYAEIQLKKAYRIARFLGRFPFVDSVYISGSLSKDFSLPDGDMDYFIITNPDRLWIARLLMHLFKKLTFVVKAQHSFCMNYYISTEKLGLDVRNYYTAIELVTLKPVYSTGGSGKLYDANKHWVDRFLPNNNWEEYPERIANKKWYGTIAAEKLINLLGGSRINKATYQFTRWKWTRKWARKGYDVEECLKCMAPEANSPLNYPRNLMQAILDGHNEIYKKAEKEAREKLVRMAHSDKPIPIYKTG